MTTENTKALVAYRLEQARESLDASTTLFQESILRSSVNRSYYAMFYAVLALLALRRRETSKHSGAISLFDTEFVKKGMFGKDFSRWLHEAFDLRQRALNLLLHHLTSVLTGYIHWEWPTRSSTG